MSAEAATNAQPQAAQAQPAAEKQTNCPACNKPIKKLRRYYRNGKFYCTKRCWSKSKQTAKENEQK
jgi:hypothetical protein